MIPAPPGNGASVSSTSVTAPGHAASTTRATRPADTPAGTHNPNRSRPAEKPTSNATCGLPEMIPARPPRRSTPCSPFHNASAPGGSTSGPGAHGHHMPATGLLPAGDGEHQPGDDDEHHHGDQERQRRPANVGQHVQNVMDDRRGVGAGMKQLAAERTTGHRRGRGVRRRGRVHGPPSGRETNGSLENTPIRVEFGQTTSRRTPTGLLATVGPSRW